MPAGMNIDLVLLDTSVWIDFFNHRPSVVGQIAALASRVAVCGVVKQEVLQGCRDAGAFAKVNAALSTFHYLPEQPEDFVAAARFYSALRKHGVTLPPQDCLVASVAIRNKALLHARDRHFKEFAGLRLFHPAATRP